MTSPNSFSLIDKPWIPALIIGGPPETLSLRDLLGRAPEIQRISSEIPTQSVAILRVVMAILLGATRPDHARTPDEVFALWEHWWSVGAFPMDIIDRYLDTVRPRFDLLDDAVPFLQVAGLTTSSGKRSGLTKLIADFPDGHPFFTTRGGTAVRSLSLEEAARWIVHCQAFDPSGIKTGAVGDARVKGGKGYPFGYPAWAGNLGLVVVEGTSLFETLMLNTPWLISGPTDLPVWERPPLGPGVEEPTHLPHGPADLFTWPSRRLRVFVDENRVVDVQISNGDKLTPQDRFVHEPMSTWRHSKNQSKGSSRVFMPVLPDPARRIWQGLEPLLSVDSTSTEYRSVQAIEWLSRLRVERILRRDHLVNLHVVGLEYGTQNSVITGAVDDRLTATVAAMTDAVLVQTAIGAAHRASKGVVALANLAGNLDRAAGGEGRAREHTFELGYSLLDGPYRSWIRSLLASEDAESYDMQWDQTASRVLRRAGDGLLADAGASAILGRRVTQLSGESILLDAGLAQIWFRAALKKAFPNSKAFPSTNDEVRS